MGWVEGGGAEYHFSARAETPVFTTVARSCVQPDLSNSASSDNAHSTACTPVVMWYMMFHSITLTALLVWCYMDNFVYEVWQVTTVDKDNGVSFLMGQHHIQLLSCASHEFKDG
jgi:hypothetical protein